MTVSEAVEELGSVGDLKVEGDTIVCRLPRRKSSAQKRALDVLRQQKPQALMLLGKDGLRRRTPPLEEILKGTGICLYSDLLGENLWICADEEDARQLIEQGEKRGAIYTANEIRLVVTIQDRDVVRQVHEFKREFDTRMLPPHKTDP